MTKKIESAKLQRGGNLEVTVDRIVAPESHTQSQAFHPTLRPDLIFLLDTVSDLSGAPSTPARKSRVRTEGISLILKPRITTLDVCTSFHI